MTLVCVSPNSGLAVQLQEARDGAHLTEPQHHSPQPLPQIRLPIGPHLLVVAGRGLPEGEAPFLGCWAEVEPEGPCRRGEGLDSCQPSQRG